MGATPVWPGPSSNLSAQKIHPFFNLPPFKSTSSAVYALDASQEHGDTAKAGRAERGMLPAKGTMLAAQRCSTRIVFRNFYLS